MKTEGEKTQADGDGISGVEKMQKKFQNVLHSTLRAGRSIEISHIGFMVIFVTTVTS